MAPPRQNDGAGDGPPPKCTAREEEVHETNNAVAPSGKQNLKLKDKEEEKKQKEVVEEASP